MKLCLLHCFTFPVLIFLFSDTKKKKKKVLYKSSVQNSQAAEGRSNAMMLLFIYFLMCNIFV